MNDSNVSAAAPEGMTVDTDSITLTKDITLSAPIVIDTIEGLTGDTVTVDGANGSGKYTITDNVANGVAIYTNGKNVTFKNIIFKTSVNFTDTILNSNGGTITFENCEFQCDGTKMAVQAFATAGSSFTFTNCTFTDNAKVHYNMAGDASSGSITFTDCTNVSVAIANNGTYGTATIGSSGCNVNIAGSTTVKTLILGWDFGNGSANTTAGISLTTNSPITVEEILVGADNKTKNVPTGQIKEGTDAAVTAQKSEVPVYDENGDMSTTVDEYDIIVGGSWDDVKAALSNGEATINGDMPDLTTTIEVGVGQTLNINNSTFYGTGTIEVNGGIVNIRNSFVYAGVDVDEDLGGQLNITGAHTLTADGTGNTDLFVGVGDTLNFTGTIPSGRTVHVYGNLVANNITVAGAVETYVGSSVTLDGTSTISGTFTLNDADMEISGTVNVRNDANGGASFVLAGTSEVTVTETGIFNVNKPTAIAAAGVNTLKVEAGATFAVEGTLNITGILDGNVQNMGTVTFNGTSQGGSISLFNGVTLTVTSVSGELTINDTGAVKDVAGNRYVADKASEGQVIILNNVRGVTITETVTSETFEDNRYYYSNMDITGTFTVLQNGASNPSIDITSTSDSVTVDGKQKYGGITLSGTSVIGSGVTVTNNKELTVTGDLSVTKGSTSAAIVTAPGVLTNNDTITVEGSIVMYDATIANTINAVHYTITTVNGQENCYTNFAAAIAAAGDADSDTVTVLGKVSVTQTAEIANGTYVAVDAAATLTIDEGVTLTVVDGASLTVVGTVDVLGTLIITNTDTGLSYGTLNYDVYTVNGKTATYTSLANALAGAQPGDVITISQNVTISSNMTIPEGVTVQTADNSITLEDKVTLTVNGTLAIQNRGSLVADTEDPALVWGDDVRLVVNGVVSDVNSADDLSAYKAAGASFEIRNTKYLTSVAYAASMSDQIDGVGTGITISGDVSFGDVTFTEGENNNLVVEFKNMGSDDDSYRGNITLVNSEMKVTSGLYTGTVSSAEGSIQLTGADGVIIPASVDDSGLEDVDVLTIEGIEAGATDKTYYIYGTVSVASGTVTAGTIDVGKNKTDSLTVASGATLQIGEGASVNVEGSETSMTVDGTLAIDNGEFAVSPTATAVINGTMSVENTNSTQVNIDGKIIIAGALNISVAEDTAAVIGIDGTLYVGAIPTALGQSTSGTVSGEVNLNATDGLIVVYDGSSIEGIDVGNNELVSTAYNINGTPYATGYTLGNKDIVEGMGAFTDEISGLDFDSVSSPVEYYSDAGMTEQIEFATGSEPAMSEYDAVYLKVALSLRTGTISAGTGLDLYIDNIKWTAGLYTLTVGTHTVSFDVRAGYDGSNATITFNGQTVENGGTIEITANGFVLVANGAVPATSTSGGSTTSGSDDGMGLTDYLLIILVVLIVIMAIMVAMRLMRS